MDVRHTRARSTGAAIVVVDNRDRSFMDEDHRWYTVCDTHSHLIGHDTRSLAVSWAASPEEWCDGCREVVRLAGTPLSSSSAYDRHEKSAPCGDYWTNLDDFKDLRARSLIEQAKRLVDRALTLEKIARQAAVRQAVYAAVKATEPEAVARKAAETAARTMADKHRTIEEIVTHVLRRLR